MAVVGPTTGFKIIDPATGATGDIGSRYISKDYLLDVYPNIISYGNNPNKTVPGIFSCGYNGEGQLGQSGIATRSSPVQIGTLTNWKQIGQGMRYSAAVKTDGTLWTWGQGSLGKLGLLSITSRSTPVQVGTLTNWKQVECMNSSSGTTLAIKTDGTLWAIGGDNSYGNFGDNTSVSKSSPVQVGALTNWKEVACGYQHSGAVKTDGTLWTWGRNSSGQLGLRDATTRSSPTQVGTLTNWKQIACGNHIAAVKTDGTLWVWGSNSYGGALGLSGGIQRSSPVQVGTDTNWKQVACGRSTTHAVKTDGTLWSWGHGQPANYTPGLGLNDITDRSSPVQVGTLTNWKFVYANTDVVTCIKTDGTLWQFGSNDYGQLAIGGTTSRSSPVQVGSLTNWKYASNGYKNFIAILDGQI